MKYVEYDQNSRLVEAGVTWKDWELGIGFFFADIFQNNFTGGLTRSPFGAHFYLGPLWLTLNLGWTRVFGKSSAERVMWVKVLYLHYWVRNLMLFILSVDIYGIAQNWGSASVLVSVVATLLAAFAVWFNQRRAIRTENFLANMAPEASPTRIRPMVFSDLEDDEPPKGAS